ncbi:capsid cement protein [Williamsia sp.]|uniref:capsid cement protein n=1 Tax=Williamsia sp. TaxID=1872085 RepID=UPI002F93B8BE
MPEILPEFAPGTDVTFTASAAITGGQLVAITGNETVGPAGTATATAWRGVAAHDAANGAKVLVLSGCVITLAASGAIAAGAQVVPAASGAVATIGAETDFTKVVGIAESAAASNLVRVKLAR